MTAPLIPDRLASGRIVDLADLPPSLHWADEIAGPLSRIARFAGQIPDCIYSVAEHSVRGARAIYDDAISFGTPSRDALADAVAFLLHDCHECLGGDVKRPFMDLCEMLAARTGLAEGGMIRRAIEEAKSHLDERIYVYAGLEWPLPPETRIVVREMDNRMAAEEMRRFWPHTPLPSAYESLTRVRFDDWAAKSAGDCPPWAAPRAAVEWLTMFKRWSPGS